MKQSGGKKLFNRNFSLLLAGQVISLFGNAIQRFAMSLYILDITGSAAVFAAITAVSYLPLVFLSPVGGAIADRFDRKKLMVRLDFASSLLILGYASTLFFLGDSIWITGTVMVVLATISAVYQPTVQASIPVIARRDHLVKANGFVSQVSSLAGLAGPIAAGLLYGFFGLQVVIIINCVSFFLSAVMELFLHIPYTPEKMIGSAVAIFSNDLKQSVRYITRGKPFILHIALIGAAVNLFITPVYIIGVPYIVKIVLNAGDQLYGITESLICLGGILGAFLVGAFAKKIKAKNMYLFFISLGIVFLLMMMSIVPPRTEGAGTVYAAYAAFTLCAVAGVALMSGFNILYTAFIQKQVPHEMMGKVMALIMASSMCCVPLGQILFGTLFESLAGRSYVIILLTSAVTLVMAAGVRKALAGKDLPEKEETLPDMQEDQ